MATQTRPRSRPTDLERKFRALQGDVQSVGRRQEVDGAEHRRRRRHAAADDLLPARQAVGQEAQRHRRDPSHLMAGMFRPVGAAAAPKDAHEHARAVEDAAARDAAVGGHPTQGDLRRPARTQRVLEGRRRRRLPARPRRGHVRAQVRAARPVSRRPGHSVKVTTFKPTDAQAAQGTGADEGQGVREGLGRDPGSELPAVSRLDRDIAVKVLLRNPRREIDVPGARSVNRLLDDLGLTARAHLVIRNGTLVPGDTRLDEDDTIEVRPVISGGDAVTAVGSKCKVCKGACGHRPATTQRPLLRRASAAAVSAPDGQGDRRLRHVAARPIGSSSRSAAARTPSRCGTC